MYTQRSSKRKFLFLAKIDIIMRVGVCTLLKLWAHIRFIAALFSALCLRQ